MTQKEGICFISDHELYITDELSSGVGQKLYYMDLQQITTAAQSVEEIVFEVKAFPNPFRENATLSLLAKESDYYTLVLYNQLGQNIFKKVVFLDAKIMQDITLDETIVKACTGELLVEISRKNELVYRKRLVKLR